MSNRRRAVVAAVPTAVALLAATASPALAQTAAPVPTPVAADAGAGLFVLRALPGATLPGVSGTGLLTGAIGSTVVTADSTKPAGQQSTAKAAPLALTLAGQTPSDMAPTTASQSASPDNPTPTTTGFEIPEPLAPLLSGGLLEGSAQARWSDTLGPCIDPISTATTSLADLSAVNVLPALSLPGLPAGGAAPTDPAAALGGLLDALASAPDQFAGLAALLTGGTTDTTSVVTLPGTASATSTTRLVDVPGQAGKGVQATSTVQLTDLSLLAGTPLEVTVGALSAPTLTATSTGDPATSTVTYDAPVLQVTQANGTVTTLSATDDPTTTRDERSFDLPLQIPVLEPVLSQLPVGLGDILSPILTPVVDGALEQVSSTLDLGVLRISYGQFTPQQEGASVAGSSSILDVAVLPTDALTGLLGDALPAGSIPDSLLQLGVGEQSARAAVAAGGVDCSVPAAPPAAAPGAPQASPPPPLAYTNAAYSTIPLLWTGTAALLLGTVLLAALPVRRRRTAD